MAERTVPAVSPVRQTPRGPSVAPARAVPGLPAPVDTSTADAEISSFLARARVSGRSSASGVSHIAERMDQFPQLSADAQGELVAAYQASLALERDLADGRVPRHRVREAKRRVAEGQTHLTYLVASNFRLVRVIAQDLAVRRNPSRDRLSVMLPDLVGEGNIALMRAAREFDPSRGPKFHTYAARVIRDQIRSALALDTPIRLTAAKSRIHRIARPLIPELTNELGRAPTIAELQEALMERCLQWAQDRLSDEQLLLPEAEQHQLKLDRLKKQGMIGAIRDIENLLARSQQMARLDAQVGDDGVTTLGDLVADPFDEMEDDVIGGAELSELHVSIAAVLVELDERERDIVLLRYGFVDNESWTFNDISEHYNVTPERIRQIDASVLERLRVADEGGGGQLRSHLPSGPAAGGRARQAAVDLASMVQGCRERLGLDGDR